MGRRKKEEILELKRKWESQEEQKQEEQLNNDEDADEDADEEAEAEAEDEVIFSDKDICGQRRCFSYREGHCECLRDTDFGGRACPFYKTVEQYEEDLRRASGAGSIKPKSMPMTSTETEKSEAQKHALSGIDFMSANASIMDELAEMEAETKRIEKGEYEDMSESEEPEDDGWDDDEEDAGGEDPGDSGGDAGEEG